MKLRCDTTSFKMLVKWQVYDVEPAGKMEIKWGKGKTKRKEDYEMVRVVSEWEAHWLTFQRARFVEVGDNPEPIEEIEDDF